MTPTTGPPLEEALEEELHGNRQRRPGSTDLGLVVGLCLAGVIVVVVCVFLACIAKKKKDDKEESRSNAVTTSSKGGHPRTQRTRYNRI